MAGMQVSAAAGAASWQAQQTQAAQPKAAARAKETSMSSPSTDLYEMIRDAREQAQATRDKFSSAKPGINYGDVPLEAYSRLARAKNAAQVSAAAGYARRQITRLKAAKRTDPDNAKRIQAAINQLQKAVHRAGKKNRDLEREKAAEARQKKLEQEQKAKEARRQRMELRRKQMMRMYRESGYIQEAEIDNRMQSQIAAMDMKLREQAQSFTSSIQPSPEAAARQYAAGTGAAAASEASAGGEIDVQA